MIWKKCTKCKKLFKKPKWRTSRCLKCIANSKKQWYYKNRSKIIEKQKFNHLKLRYNITIKEYFNLCKKQKGLCKICKRKPKINLSVDHNHETNKFRGLICGSCNRALGLFQDSVKILNKALLYLKEN